jgi:Na+/alanine symporter
MMMVMAVIVPLKTVAPWFSSLLTLAVVLFAFSTMLSYSFYGKNAIGTTVPIDPGDDDGDGRHSANDD